MESRGQEEHPFPARGKDSLCMVDDEDGKASTAWGPSTPMRHRRLGGVTYLSESEALQ